jgi:uncharacterized protein DUF5681
MSKIPDESGAGSRKPPRKGQFKLGASGNPGGRPKGSRTLRAELMKILKERIAVRESGKRKQITRQEAMLLTLLEKALRGDVRAASMIMNIVLRLEPNESEKAAPDEALAEDDIEIVAAFLRRNQLSNTGE